MISINLDHLIVIHIIKMVLIVVNQSERKQNKLLIYLLMKNYLKNKELKLKLFDKK
jgi:hypothetical protein